MNRIPAASLSVLFALGVAACGQDSAPRNEVSAQGNTSAPAAPAAAAAPAAPQASDDQAVASKVRTALESIPGVKSEQISVTVSDGAVTLVGPVESAQEHKQILARVSQLDGVKSVVDDLQPVKGS